MFFNAFRRTVVVGRSVKLNGLCFKLLLSVYSFGSFISFFSVVSTTSPFDRIQKPVYEFAIEANT